VVDLRAGTLLHTVALPENSGATGVAFVNDSIALVANPGRNTVSPVNVNRGTVAAEIPTGTYPHVILSDGARVYIINANLESWTPAGPGTVTVLDASLGFVRTIQLSGMNPADAAIRGNRLYVLHAGSWGADNGSLSVVDLQSMAEESHHRGFGDYPSSLAVAANGELYAGIYGSGVIVWNPTTRAFVRGTDQPLTPGGSGVVSGLGFDHAGRLHVVDPGSCTTGGTMSRFSGGDTPERTVTVGICPFGIAFADIFEER
jgi:hypothetical protein